MTTPWLPIAAAAALLYWSRNSGGDNDGDRIPGGLSEGMVPEDFDPVELRRGTIIEMEHTTDVRVAQEIAMDHLVEDPHYYIKLEAMERG